MPNSSLPTPMETERLILRSYTEEDAAWYYEMSLKNREHLRRYESGNVTMSLTSEEHTRKTLSTLAKYWSKGVCYFAGGFDKVSGEFVAQVYVGPFNRQPAEFVMGYMANCAYEGRGYVSEAVTVIVADIFQHLGADQVRIHCDEANERSRRVAECCGFRLAKTFAEEKLRADGLLHACTTAVYLRLRSDVASG